MNENVETEKQLKVVAKSAGLVFIGLVFSKFFTYIFRLILARYYGPQDYGLISIGLSVITVLITFLILGMDAGIIRYVSEYKAKSDEKRVKGSIVMPIKVGLILSLVATIFFWQISPYLAGYFSKDVVTQSNLTLIFQLFSLTLPFSVMYNLLLAATKGFQKIDYWVYTDNIFYSVVLVVSVILFSFLGFGLIGIAWSYVVTVISSFIFIFYFFNKQIYNIFNKIKPLSETKKMLNYAFPLFIGSAAIIIIGSFDTIFLGILRNSSDVGIYNAALPTAKFMLVFGSAFVAIFAQLIIEYRATNREKNIPIIYKVITKWIFLTAFCFVLLFVFFSRNVLNLLFGPEYISAAGSLSILSIAFFIQSILLASHLILTIDKTKYVMINVIIAAIMNVVLNIILIPQYGIFGAALATSSSVIFSSVLDFFLTWKLNRINPFGFKSIIKTITAGLISLSLVLFIYRYFGMLSSSLILIILFVIFIALYFMLLIIFKTFDKNDIFIFREIQRKTGIKIKLRFFR